MVGVRYNDRDDYVSVSLKFIQRSKSTFLSAVEMQIKVVETSEYRSRSKEFLCFNNGAVLLNA